jgi:hypothetical protein
LIFAANKLANAIWTIFIGAGTLVLFIFVFDIQMNPQWFIAVLLGGAVLSGVVLRWPPQSEWLRPAAIVMVVITFGTAAGVSIYPSLRSKDGIRMECIEQWYLYGVPVDPVLKTRCEANVEANLMSTLNAFAELHFKVDKVDKVEGSPAKASSLTPVEQQKFDAYDGVIQAAMKGKVKPLVIPAPPKPPESKTVTATSPAPKAKPAPVAKKPSQKETLLESIRKRHDAIAKQ